MKQAVDKVENDVSRMCSYFWLLNLFVKTFASTHHVMFVEVGCCFVNYSLFTISCKASWCQSINHGAPFAGSLWKLYSQLHQACSHCIMVGHVPMQFKCPKLQNVGLALLCRLLGTRQLSHVKSGTSCHSVDFPVPMKGINFAVQLGGSSW